MVPAAAGRFYNPSRSTSSQRVQQTPICRLGPVGQTNDFLSAGILALLGHLARSLSSANSFCAGTSKDTLAKGGSRAARPGRPSLCRVPLGCGGLALKHAGSNPGWLGHPGRRPSGLLKGEQKLAMRPSCSPAGSPPREMSEPTHSQLPIT